MFWKIKLREVFGGQGSGNFGHAGRPGEVGGSGEEGGVERPPIMDSIDRNISKWQSGSDYSAKESAYFTMSHDKTVQLYLRERHFGKDYKDTQVVKLYRVGSANQGIASFFTDIKSAESYQRRMGVDQIFTHKAQIQDIYPIGERGEVWVDISNVEIK